MVFMFLYYFFVSAAAAAALPIGAAINNPSIVNQAPALYLVGGLERIFAMTFHIAASLIVS